MTNPNTTQTIPINKIEEGFAWRDWLQKAGTKLAGLGSMSTQNTGASGSFKTSDSKVVTVVNGIITNIQ